MNPKKLQEFKEWFDEYQRHLNERGMLTRICENQQLMCAVITLDKHKAKHIMEERGAVKLFESKYGIDWEMGNERWRWRYWDRQARACRFHKIIVDKDIDEELLNLLTPLFTHCCFSVEIV